MTHPDQVTNPGRERIESIQILRCLAASLVVLYHTDLHVFRLSGGQHTHAFNFAAAGTDLLFVISGFIMVHIAHGSRVGFGEFIFRRIARIAPLYWLLTLLMLATYLVWPKLFNSTAFDPWHLLASLAFLPHAHPVLGVQRPFLFPGWALNYFVFFYVLFGAFLFLPTTRRIAVVGIILCGLTALWLRFYGTSPVLDFYGAPIVLDFVVGMIVAWFFVKRRAIGILPIAVVFALSAGIFAAGVSAGVSGGHERFLYWGLADAGLLFSFVFFEREWGLWSPGLLTRLGDASFAIYLSNLFSLAVVAKAVQATGLFAMLGIAGVQALMVVSALAAGFLLNSLVERPLHASTLRYGARWLNGLLPRVKPPTVVDL